MKPMTYECSICLSVNHASKLHCSTCGTIPAQYSMLGRPSKMVEGIENFDLIETIVAFGAERLTAHHAKRISGFRTVTATYYAESEI